MAELRRVAVTINEARAVITVVPEAPAALTQRLASLLPYSTELHYAKISGQSVLFLVPFFVPPQQAVHVNRLVPGRITEGPDQVAAAGEALRTGRPDHPGFTRTPMLAVKPEMEAMMLRQAPRGKLAEPRPARRRRDVPRDRQSPDGVDAAGPSP